MTSAEMSAEISTAFYSLFVLLLPPLVIVATIGLLIALLQAVTQIQDQSFAQIVKLLVIATILYGFAGSLSAPLVDQGLHVFSAFPRLVRN